jgi:HlyD family secretion protein
LSAEATTSRWCHGPGKIGEFVERKVTAEDQLKRTDIRAPQDGVVFQSTANTVGGVITAGDPIMLIVPETDTLLVEVKVDPKDIDQVKLGQPVLLRFSAFNMRTTPELNGTVSRIAADTSFDQRTGQNYYVVRIAMTNDEIKRLGDVRLTPGMPVEAFIQTGERTLMSYLVKPLRDRFMRSFREKWGDTRLLSMACFCYNRRDTKPGVGTICPWSDFLAGRGGSA